jgi:hypothetical protein
VRREGNQCFGSLDANDADGAAGTCSGSTFSVSSTTLTATGTAIQAYPGPDCPFTASGATITATDPTITLVYGFAHDGVPTECTNISGGPTIPKIAILCAAADQTCFTFSDTCNASCP